MNLQNKYHPTSKGSVPPADLGVELNWQSPSLKFYFYIKTKVLGNRIQKYINLKNKSSKIIFMENQYGVGSLISRVFFKVLFVYFKTEGKGGKERDRNISVWLPVSCSLLGTWSATQACALTGNQTSDLLIHRPALSPLSHTGQGSTFFCAHFSMAFKKNLMEKLSAFFLMVFFEEIKPISIDKVLSRTLKSHKLMSLEDIRTMLLEFPLNQRESFHKASILSWVIDQLKYFVKFNFHVELTIFNSVLQDLINSFITTVFLLIVAVLAMQEKERRHLFYVGGVSRGLCDSILDEYFKTL